MSHTLTHIIRNFDEKIGQITVEVTCAEHGESVLFAVDLPVKEDNTYPVGDELNALIDSMTPTWHFERMDKTTAGVSNVDVLKGLVVPYSEPEIIEQATTNVGTL